MVEVHGIEAAQSGSDPGNHSISGVFGPVFGRLSVSVGSTGVSDRTLAPGHLDGYLSRPIPRHDWRVFALAGLRGDLLRCTETRLTSATARMLFSGSIGVSLSVLSFLGCAAGKPIEGSLGSPEFVA